jgi:negative regulator of sigma E activity
VRLLTPVEEDIRQSIRSTTSLPRYYANQKQSMQLNLLLPQHSRYHVQCIIYSDLLFLFHIFMIRAN